jgi:hypothetical protein
MDWLDVVSPIQSDALFVIKERRISIIFWLAVFLPSTPSGFILEVV